MLTQRVAVKPDEWSSDDRSSSTATATATAHRSHPLQTSRHGDQRYSSAVSLFECLHPTLVSRHAGLESRHAAAGVPALSPSLPSSPRSTRRRQADEIVFKVQDFASVSLFFLFHDHDEYGGGA